MLSNRGDKCVGDTACGPRHEAEACQLRQSIWTDNSSMVEVVYEESAVSFSNTGEVVWPAAKHLSQLLCNEPSLLNGRRVLELGAGSGFLASVAASLGADVLATDRVELLPRLQRAATLGTTSQHFRTAALEWKASLQPPWPAGHFDIIFGSDITYGSFNDLSALLDLLWKMIKESNSSALLTHCMRSCEQTIILWRSFVDLWPGAVWIYDGYDVLEACHMNTAVALDSFITFGLSAKPPLHIHSLMLAHAAFLQANAAKPLGKPAIEIEEIYDGFVGPLASWQMAAQ